MLMYMTYLKKYSDYSEVTSILLWMNIAAEL
jgi:hypothetical protein